MILFKKTPTIPPMTAAAPSAGLLAGLAGIAPFKLEFATSLELDQAGKISIFKVGNKFLCVIPEASDAAVEGAALLSSNSRGIDIIRANLEPDLSRNENLEVILDRREGSSNAMTQIFFTGKNFAVSRQSEIKIDPSGAVSRIKHGVNVRINVPGLELIFQYTIASDGEAAGHINVHRKSGKSNQITNFDHRGNTFVQPDYINQVEFPIRGANFLSARDAMLGLVSLASKSEISDPKGLLENMGFPPQFFPARFL